MSHLREISTPCWLRKCYSSRFLPRTLSEFQQARRKGLARSVLLGRATIFGHKENDGLQDSPRAGSPCETGGDGCEKPTSQLHTCQHVGKVIEIKFPPEERWNIGLGKPGWGSGFSGRGFDTGGYFALRLPSSQLRGCCGFGLRLLWPARLPGGRHFKLL